MKINLLFFTIVIGAFLGGCAKQETAKDADFWYKKSLQELRLEQPGEIAWRKALTSIDQALSLDASRERYWVLKGSLLLKLGMPKMSVDAFEQALKCSKVPALRAEVLNNYACALAELGKEEKALARWEEALTTPSYVTPEVVHCNRAQYWLHKKEYSKALSSLELAIQAGGEYSDAYFFKALTLYHLKRYSQAYDVLVVLLAFDPDYQPALALQQELKKFLSPAG